MSVPLALLCYTPQADYSGPHHPALDDSHLHGEGCQLVPLDSVYVGYVLYCLGPYPYDILTVRPPSDWHILPPSSLEHLVEEHKTTLSRLGRAEKFLHSIIHDNLPWSIFWKTELDREAMVRLYLTSYVPAQGDKKGWERWHEVDFCQKLLLRVQDSRSESTTLHRGRLCALGGAPR